MEKKKTRRVQLELPPKSMQLLEKLKKRIEASSYSEVFKNAMMLYNWLTDRHANGDTFFVRDGKTGEMKEVEFFKLF